MLFMNLLAPVAILRKSAKQTEFCLSSHQNMRSQTNKALYKHLRHCDQIQHIQGLYNLPDIFTNKNGLPPIATDK